MKQKSPTKSTDSELTNLEKRLNLKFEKIERLFTLSDEKNSSMEKRVRSEINSATYLTSQKIERTLEAQILLATKELKIQLRETEDMLNKRIGNVGDLITIMFTKKIKGLEKRVFRLEQATATI